MSYIPYTTQAGPICTPEGSQKLSIVYIIYLKNLTPHQLRLMKECQDYLHHHVQTSVKDASEINEIPRNAKFFVIPSIREDIVKQLKFIVSPINPCIYTPRAIIETRGLSRFKLPIRSVAISLSMDHCHIFITRSCNSPELKQKIFEMCGSVAPDFKDIHLNVVITDRADDKYCLRARQKNIACVTRSWVLDHHRESLKDDETLFCSNALAVVGKYQVKPFFGLLFKISIKHSESYIKNLIAENQGRVVYGAANTVTHEVVDEYISSNYEDLARSARSHSNSVCPKKVDFMFIEACAKLGYYLSHEEYKDYMNNEEGKRMVVKQEQISQMHSMRSNNTQSQIRRPPASLDSEECFTPPVPPPNTRLNGTFAPPQVVNGYARSQVSQRSQCNENQSMLPPSQIGRLTRPQQQQYNHPDTIMNDVILRVLHGYDNGSAQTQLASTQMRGLPERAIQIEQTMEPSQQLYWSDAVSKRN